MLYVLTIWSLNLQLSQIVMLPLTLTHMHLHHVVVYTTYYVPFPFTIKEQLAFDLI